MFCVSFSLFCFLLKELSHPTSFLMAEKKTRLKVSLDEIQQLRQIGYAYDSILAALQQQQGDFDKTLEVLISKGEKVMDPLPQEEGRGEREGIHRRFELKGHWIFNGVYHFDGFFEGAVRYRATFREDWWILKKDGEWWGCGHGLCQKCSAVSMGIPKSARGRVVGGVEEFPFGEKQIASSGEYGPYDVWLVSNLCCGYDRQVKT